MTGQRRIGPVLKFFADEDFDRRILLGIRKGNPSIDVITVQEANIRGTPDPALLERAAQEGRIMLSRDTRTMRPSAYARVAAGLPMPGLFLVRQNEPMGPVIEDILLRSVTSLEGEWDNRVEYLPIP